MKTNPISGFRCLACEAVLPASFSGMLCPACGGNLDIEYDYTAIDPNNWLLDRDDMFRYAPLLPIRSLEFIPPQRIGQTPLYHARRAGELLGLKQLFIKDDGLNPSASFKDRASAVALAVARERGAAMIAGATTGNAGSSMACLAAGAGFPCVIFVPQSAPAAKLAQLLVFGAKVLAVRGTYDQAYDLCRAVCDRLGWFNRNTGYNPYTREGKKTCAFEMWEQLGRRAPDRVLVCTGDGNIISGIWKGFRDLKALGLIEKLPRLHCVQSEKSAAISMAVREVDGTRPARWGDVVIPTVPANTIADSISVDYPRDGIAGVRAVFETGGEAVTVSDEEIVAAIPELARATGVFAEPAAAASWAGLVQLTSAGKIHPDERVVCLISGNGLKDVARARQAAGEPITVEPDADAVVRALGM
ncbi:MAG TPA: threonine synthase [Kiritimatiellia bacterium]|nr:threonine synthase [Kiritimatiellia bacterium]HMO97514.1 threonine synthase [Kiritimatiellia bacterium]HMP97143.1 threonine synthase [Kiritimatiellia bacterium]